MSCNDGTAVASQQVAKNEGMVWSHGLVLNLSANGGAMPSAAFES